MNIDIVRLSESMESCLENGPAGYHFLPWQQAVGLAGTI
jgi:hypothetical protein